MRHVATIVLLASCGGSPAPAPKPIKNEPAPASDAPGIAETRAVASLSPDESRTYCEGLDRARAELVGSTAVRAACLMQVVGPMFSVDASTEAEVRATCTRDFDECVAAGTEQPSLCGAVEAAGSMCKSVTLQTLTACTLDTQRVVIDLVAKHPCEGIVGKALYDRLRLPSCIELETSCNN